LKSEIRTGPISLSFSIYYLLIIQHLMVNCLAVKLITGKWAYSFSEAQQRLHPLADLLLC
jgi:CxxC motif-containing protein (DUF1111 family)